MIVLDTNVVSEAMKPQPHPDVRSWLNAQSPETLFLTSVTAAEVLFGISCLVESKRKSLLTDRFDHVMTLFSHRILPFDTDAAHSHAKLAWKARRAGRGFPVPDGYIAAIAFSCGFRIASRDLTAYLAAGVPVINPWQA